MKNVCAWCLRELSPATAEARPASHGICRACADRFLGDRPLPLEQYLDDLPVPVMVLDPDDTIGFANRQAQLLLQLSGEQIAGRKGGDVLLCTYARGHEGCGRGAHCPDCAVRACVRHTQRTGEPRVMVPALLDTGGALATALTITTLKRGESVLLLLNSCDEAEAPPAGPERG